MTGLDTSRLQNQRTSEVPPGMVDRRRAARPENASPELIALMRGTRLSPPAIDLHGRSGEQLGAMRGLVVGVILSTVIWTFLLRAIF